MTDTSTQAALWLADWLEIHKRWLAANGEHGAAGKAGKSEGLIRALVAERDAAVEQLHEIEITVPHSTIIGLRTELQAWREYAGKLEDALRCVAEARHPSGDPLKFADASQMRDSAAAALAAKPGEKP